MRLLYTCAESALDSKGVDRWTYDRSSLASPDNSSKFHWSTFSGAQTLLRLEVRGRAFNFLFEISETLNDKGADRSQPQKMCGFFGDVSDQPHNSESALSKVDRAFRVLALRRRKKRYDPRCTTISPEFIYYRSR
jgi:hypothetical protein